MTPVARPRHVLISRRRHARPWWRSRRYSAARGFRTERVTIFAISLQLLVTGAVSAVNVTLPNTLAGKTPEIVGYNSGHFMPNSNTADWWRYSGVNGARVWPTPTTVEASDDLAPWGDGVSSQATFEARRTALRENPLSSSYINWAYLEGRYQNNPTTGSNIINLKYAFGQLRALGIDPLVEINYTDGSFPWDAAGTTAGWADRWEQWQHFYAQAFYLAKNFDVHRFQMYNEPNGDNIPASEWLERLHYASDAVQAAVADVNVLYGKSLDAQVQGPVTAGNPITYYPTWGQPMIQNLHETLFGTVDPNFSLIDTYAYQRYGLTGDSFGTELGNVKNTVNAAAGGTAMRYAISEFNVQTAGNFDNITDTLDTPSQFSRFGSILAQLANNKPDELYVFKFSQGPGDGPTGVKKNGTHFVDNNNSPYNIGGSTAGGEVVRLFAKGFAGSNDLFTAPTRSGTGATDLRMAAARDTANSKYYLFSANEGTSTRSLTINLTGWGIAPGARAIVEEVSSDRHGEVSQIITVPTNGILDLSQPAQSVFLVSVLKSAPAYVRTLGVSDDAMVKSGTNANANFGSSPNLFAKNDAVDPAARNVTFIKFDTGTLAKSSIENAILQVYGENTGTDAAVITHVYGIADDNWSESTITWNNAPNLKDSLGTAVDDISENFIDDVGNTAHILGHFTGIAASRTLSLDVSDFVRENPDRQVTFLIAREVRFDGENVDDALASLRLASKERGTDPGPQLLLMLDSTALPGDYDRNGAVDINDYNVWRQNYGTTNSTADGNGDGIVDAADYTIWRTNVGMSLPGIAAGFARDMVAVPEPTIGAAALIVAAIAAQLRCGRVRPVCAPLAAFTVRGTISASASISQSLSAKRFAAAAWCTAPATVSSRLAVPRNCSSTSANQRISPPSLAAIALPF